MIHIKTFFDLTHEKGVLHTSICVTAFIAVIGVVFGMAAGSSSIIFDGVYSLADASMTMLALLVVRLIAADTASNPQKKGRWQERFSLGFWHLEPMVLALNGVLLGSVAFYALINAVSSLLSGGRDLSFGFAIAYAAVTATACCTMAIVEKRANAQINSDFIRLDIKSWVMSASITAALLVAFCIGLAVQDTPLAWISPYIDPVVLGVICLFIIPLPVSTIRQALADIFLIAPADLKAHVDRVASEFIARHGFLAYHAYVAKVGRARQIEIFFIVPENSTPRAVGDWDALRDEVGHALGGEGPDRWLTIVFTADPEWAQ